MTLRLCRHRILALLALAAATACQTTDDIATTSNWSPAPLQRASENRERTAVVAGAPLFAPSRAGPSTILEGNGRFVGEPPTGSVRASADAGDDGITLNLVNVPAPQAAKTILGDILAVKYTVDPRIDGKVTIQTPKPVTRAAAVDLFQAALRVNNAAIVSKDGAPST